MIPDVRKYFEAAAPEFSVKMQPAGRTLINFDTVFYADYSAQDSSGGRARLDTTVDVLGFPVRIVATPSWVWTFEPGATRTYETPGAPYPDKTITHRYERAGARAVSVQATWEGRFYVAGDGPYDIDQPVTQSRSTDIEVVTARSELVSGPDRR